uniref:Uncharacterized protein n=1 Tax=Kalanchoe fedtschenkoi TaxID=63787 RepID=A0A7N0UD20_KALFE
MRSKVQKEMMMKEKEKKEQELKALAQRARAERTGVAPPPPADPLPSGRTVMDGGNVGREPRHVREKDMDYSREQVEDKDEKMRRERDKIREERRRERERERRLEAKDAPVGKKSKTTRDRERDVSEKVALGMASATAGRGGEVMYDQRLFNQDKGMGSGFGNDDQYNVYDKGLFTTQSVMSTLYNPKSSKDSDTYVDADADKELDKLKNTSRFKPDKAFGGASERAGPRSGPVEFEKDVEEADPFGLDQFLTEVKKGKKAMDKIGSGGTMRASGGSSRDDVGGSGRTRVNFERGGR